ncbi:MAG: NAD(P)/FAD-dependent oxidoreductase [Geminicoccaceae bacterium]
MTERYPIEGSRDALWRATAVGEPVTERLGGDLDVDVAIVGAGFTGLNAALALAEADTSVAVLEAAHLGYGASGRSGGQVNLGLNLGPSALIEHFGKDAGERLIETIVRVPDEVFGLIRHHRLDCDPVQNGWVQGAATPAQRKMQEDLARDYQRHGGRFDVLDTEEVMERSGAHGYQGGLFCPSAGSLHPLSYTRELARVAMDKGARLITEARVNALHKDGGRWQLACEGGRVSAETVLICTNAYTDGLIPGLKETLVPVRSVLMASEPLSPNLRAKVMPNQVTFVDKRRLILYLRYDRDGRLCAGDHGPMRDDFALEDYENVKKRVVDVFPDLAGVRWDFHWGGRVAMTRSKLPFIHVVDRGLIAGMGYNGRGVGMGSIMGRILADFALGKEANALPFPVTTPKTFPFHRLHALGASIAIKWHGMLDHLEMRRQVR